MPEEADTRAADLREVLADARDAAADARDQAADDRDRAAARREQQLDRWEAQLRAWELQLGLADDPLPVTADQPDAADQRLPDCRATVLAATFARIAEGLHASPSPEELLTRIAEAALATIAGATGVAVTVAEPDPGRSSSADQTAEGTVLSFPLDTGSLEVFAADPDAPDSAARELGFILAAHASVAARSVGERVRLEGVGLQLERALLSRDEIGQAKGILMERLGLTPEEAFEILRQASQRLNVKLREVARSLTETGSLPPADGARPGLGERGRPRPSGPTGDRLA